MRSFECLIKLFLFPSRVCNSQRQYFQSCNFSIVKISSILLYHDNFLARCTEIHVYCNTSRYVPSTASLVHKNCTYLLYVYLKVTFKVTFSSSSKEYNSMFRQGIGEPPTMYKPNQGAFFVHVCVCGREGDAMYLYYAVISYLNLTTTVNRIFT